MTKSNHRPRFGGFMPLLRRKLPALNLLLIFSMLAAFTAVALAANPSANLDQCANDPAPSPSTDGCDTSASQWVNGNLGASKASYFEGDSIPYRLRMDNLSLTSHTVTIEWDTTKSGTHALDYLTTFNQTVATADPCLGVSGCGSPSTFPIPADPQVTGGGVTPIAGNFTLYGGTITSVSAYSYPDGAGFAGDKSAQISITFTASVVNPVLAWGGHIATRADWGSGNSAVTIPGSPYHTRLIDLDGAGGNQDRSLSADAVTFPASITIIKDAVPNDPQDFSFTSTGGLTPSSFSLDDDNDGTLSNTQQYLMITDFTSYSFTEAAVAQWTLSFGNPVCTVTSANGGSQSGNTGTRTVTINLAEGENVTCTFINTHTVNSPTITTQLSATSITVGGSVHDSATLSGATANAGGTVTYTVYSDNACSQDARDAGTVNVTNGNVPDSNSLTFNSAGTFYWQASYSGDANNNSAISTCTSEVVTVGKATPTLTTNASGPVTVGQDIHDTATLAGGFGTLGGSLTFDVFAPGDTTCATPINVPPTVTVNGAGNYNSGNYTTSAVGVYRWIAHYSGDANNNPVDTACNDANEASTVNPASPGITTTPNPDSGTVGVTLNDSASLTGGFNPTGSITFNLYGPSDPNCSGQPVFSNTVPVNGNGSYSTSSGFASNAIGTYHWTASYSGDGNNDPVSSGCADEPVTVGSSTPSITTTPNPASGTVGVTLNDSASLTGGLNPTGSITFNLYGPSDPNCSGQPVFSNTVPVNGDGSYSTSSGFASNATGTYHWTASYSGDSNNNGTSSGCADEPVTVNKVSPSINTTPSPSSGTVGVTLNDSASLSGGLNPTGSITFNLYGPSDPNCSGQPVFSNTVPVNGNGSYSTSSGFASNTTGTYHWTASYSGDGNNDPASSGCADEPVTVGPASPGISTTPNPSSGTVGVTLNDSASLTGGLNPTGSITFNLYGPSDPNCSGQPVFSNTVPVNGNGNYSTSSGFASNATGTYHWTASYSGDGNNNGTSSGCADEPVTVNKASPGISTTPNPSSGTVGVTLNDSASVTGGFNPTGSVTFKLYSPSDATCSGTPAYQQTVALSGGSASTSPGFVSNAAGTWRWTATYSGDANNNSASSGCNAEQVTISQPVQSQITPTQTTCQQFRDGSSPTLSQLQYTVKSGKVSTVSPGVFFYWVKVTATAGSNTFTINQAITTGNYDSHFFNQASGSFAYTSACSKINANIFTSNGVTTVTFNTSSAGTYYIGIKYDSKSVQGFAAPSPTTVHYTFELNGSPSSNKGLDLVKK